jgi:uncharacterized Zn-binding protein involved in type VI secretion
MGGIVRVGDPVSCGDHAATGSNNVFINDMPVVHMGAKNTTGHGCFPPTVFISGWAKTIFVNGQPVALKGITRIQPHRCGKNVHDGVVIEGSLDTFAENE